MILKSQERFKSKKHNIFTEEADKIILCADDNKRVQSIHSKETYTYGTSKDLLCEKEETNCNNIIKQYKND